ncbi:unnamed protein product, partial [marine sediment metagenome]
PDQSGDVVFEAIKKDIFYIFTETGLIRNYMSYKSFSMGLICL